MPNQRPVPIKPALAGRPIRLIGVPFGAGAGTRGSELGPAAMQLSGLAPSLRALGHDIRQHGDLVPASAADQEAPLAAIGHHAEEASRWISATHDEVFAALNEGHHPLVIGGDHSISMGSVSAAARHATEQGKTLVLLWIDAHADFNTPATSPSGNLHGMSVAFLTGNRALAPLLRGRAFTAIPTRNVYLVGSRSVDRDEKAAIAAAGIHCLDMRAIDEFGICALLRDVLAGLDPRRAHVHVSFDLDVVEPALAPGVGTPVAGGMTYREAHLVMEMLHESGVVTSADFVELNPMLDHAGQTARLAVDLASSLYGKAISFAAKTNTAAERAA